MHKPPYSEPFQKEKGHRSILSAYQAERIDPDIAWAEESFEKLVNIPRIFLKKPLTGIVAAGKEQSITKITPEVLDEIRDKRNAEKNESKPKLSHVSILSNFNTRFFFLLM
ncbi:MAG: hypothetical protein ACFFC7_16700 [Candidatus Hermodarchaeota archaeon]